METAYSLDTTRIIIQQKVKESNLKDVTFGKIESFNIFTTSKEHDKNQQFEDSDDSQVQTPYLSSQ